MKASNPTSNAQSWMGPLGRVLNQLIADPLRYERTNKIFFSLLGNAYGRSRKCKLQANRKLQSFCGSEPSNVSGSQTLTFSTLGGAGGYCRATRFWAKCCRAPKN